MTPAYGMERELDSAEVAQGRRYLEQTRDYAIGATRGLSPAQWNFKPAMDRWSIAENLEHIVVVLERVLGPIREQLAQAQAPPERESRQVDAIVIHQFPVRAERFRAPEFVWPAGRWAPSEALERLRRNYACMIADLESAGDLRLHAIEAAPLKAVSKGAHKFLDGYQWLLTAAAHTERHVKQILEVKADPGFPSG